MNFKEAKIQFNNELETEEGYAIMQKVTNIVRDVGGNFLTMNGGELSEAQAKLAGYKFYLADFIGELNVRFESLRLEIRDIKSVRWGEVTEEIKAKDGKVKNKEQIENEIVKDTIDRRNLQMLNETLYYQYKLKIASIDSILTAIVQRIASLKREEEQSKM
jgi:hypothetical protein